MGTVYLAANGISFLANTASHMQFAYESDAGVWREVEVQSSFLRTLGDWVFHADGTRPHGGLDSSGTPYTTYVNADGSTTDPSLYRRIELTPQEGQSAEQLWDAIINFGEALSVSASGANYDVFQNSNSFAFTILEGLGYEADALTVQVRPASAGGFPGGNLNILEDGALLSNAPGAIGDIRFTVPISVSGSTGNDVLVGGRGNDQLNGHSGNDLLVGGRGNDQMNGGGGQDAVAYYDSGSGVHVSLNQTQVVNTGGQGDDRLFSIEDVVGSNSNDTLTGDGRANLLVGLSGNDTLSGGFGNDTLMGGTGSDEIRGGAGEDIIAAGSGSDQVWGGSDSDDFFFEDNGGLTTINDFELGIDFIFIDGSTNAVSQINFGATAQGLAMQFSGNIVLLEGVFASIDSDHFLFA